MNMAKQDMAKQNKNIERWQNKTWQNKTWQNKTWQNNHMAKYIEKKHEKNYIKRPGIKSKD